jgi:hypothetical protein
MYVCVCMYVCMYVCICVCVYVYMYGCVPSPPEETGISRRQQKRNQAHTRPNHPTHQTKPNPTNQPPPDPPTHPPTHLHGGSVPGAGQPHKRVEDRTGDPVRLARALEQQLSVPLPLRRRQLCARGVCVDPDAFRREPDPDLPPRRVAVYVYICIYIYIIYIYVCV